MGHERSVTGQGDQRVREAAADTFVGRTRELAELRARGTSHCCGSRQRVVPHGRGGIGKTRLSAQFASVAGAEGARVLWGRCREDQGAPAYWPWIQVIRTCARSADPDLLSAQLGSAAAYVAQLVPELAELVPTFPTNCGTDSLKHARFYQFDAITAFLRRGDSGDGCGSVDRCLRS